MTEKSSKLFCLQWSFAQGKLCIKHICCMLLFHRHHVWIFPIWCWILLHQWTTLSRQMKTSRNLIVEFIRLEIQNLFLFGSFFVHFIYVSFFFSTFISTFSLCIISRWFLRLVKANQTWKMPFYQNVRKITSFFCSFFHVVGFFLPWLIWHPSDSHEIWDTSEIEIPKRNQLLLVRIIIVFYINGK